MARHFATTPGRSLMKKPRRNTKKTEALPEWERLLSAQMFFQSEFPECVLVGGTAAALHAHHRISLDADYVLSDLRKRFQKIVQAVEAAAGWRTNRLEPPVLILGNFHGVRTGVRQLIRAHPLETTTVHGLRIPTPEEMLRIKGYLIVRRNATRDFLDFIALWDHLGVHCSLPALHSLDWLYPQAGDTTISQQLALQLAEPKPWDLSHTNLSNYKALQAPYTDWTIVQHRTATAAQKIMLELLRK